MIPVGGSPVLGPSASNQIGVAGGSVNGARISNNDFRFDGIQSQDTDQSVLVVLPSPDAIQEFKVQTSAMDASFGRAGGATVNLILKSGTNEARVSATSALEKRVFTRGRTQLFFDTRDSTMFADVTHVPRVLFHNSQGV